MVFPLAVLVGINIGIATMDNSMEIPLKTRNKTIISLSNPTTGPILEETRTEKDTCAPMFIAALFKIARMWELPRCPSMDKWIKKIWYVYTMEYYSAIKRNKFESVELSWMNRMSLLYPVK